MIKSQKHTSVILGACIGGIIIELYIPDCFSEDIGDDNKNKYYVSKIFNTVYNEYRSFWKNNECANCHVFIQLIKDQLKFELNQRRNHYRQVFRRKWLFV